MLIPKSRLFSVQWFEVNTNTLEMRPHLACVTVKIVCMELTSK